LLLTFHYPLLSFAKHRNLKNKTPHQSASIQKLSFLLILAVYIKPHSKDQIDSFYNQLPAGIAIHDAHAIIQTCHKQGSYDGAWNGADSAH
jgi:hypothetical protein